MKKVFVLLFAVLLLTVTGCGRTHEDGSVDLKVVKGEYRAVWEDHYRYDTPILIETFADWQKFLEDHPAQSAAEDFLEQEYTEGFFGDHLLYVFLKGEASGSNTLTVKGANLKNDTLELLMERVVPDEGTDDLATRICIFGVKKEDVKNVTTVKDIILEQ